MKKAVCSFRWCFGLIQARIMKEEIVFRKRTNITLFFAFFATAFYQIAERGAASTKSLLCVSSVAWCAPVPVPVMCLHSLVALLLGRWIFYVTKIIYTILLLGNAAFSWWLKHELLKIDFYNADPLAQLIYRLFCWNLMIPNCESIILTSLAKLTSAIC